MGSPQGPYPSWVVDGEDAYPQVTETVEVSPDPSLLSSSTHVCGKSPPPVHVGGSRGWGTSTPDPSRLYESRRPPFFREDPPPTRESLWGRFTGAVPPVTGPNLQSPASSLQ